MIRNLGLALAAGILALVAAEVVVRLAHLAPEVTAIEVERPPATFVPSESPVLKYEPKPGAGDVNAYGARDFPFELTKPAGAVRVVVLGDSIGFGFCNDREHLAIDATFPKVLERELRARLGPQVQVLNLSVSGYDTVQEVEFLVRKGLALRPDLVLVAYCLNDEWDASAEFLAFDRRGASALLGRSEAFRRLYLASYLVRFAHQRTGLLARRFERDGAGSVAAGERTEHGFAELAALAAREGFRVAVATFPLFEDWEGYAHAGEHAAVARRAAARGFEHLDLLPAFRAASRGSFRTLQGRCNREHPDEVGHRVAGRAMAEFLVGEGLVPAPPP